MAHNIPLVSGLASFAECVDSLKLHPATAVILDDIRFLINVVLSLPPEPSHAQLQKVQSTAIWVHDMIARLHPTNPSTHSTTRARTTLRSEPSAKSASVSSTRESDTVGEGDTRNSLQGKGKTAESSQTRTSPLAERQQLEGFPSRRGSEAGTAPTSTLDHSPEAESLPSSPDYMYKVVRMSALVFARAIMERKPISETCRQAEFLQIWTTTWRVPLSDWKAMNGIFIWVMMSIAPCCHKTPHSRFVRSMLVLAIQSMALDNWHVAVDAMITGIRLVTWLREGEKWMNGAERGEWQGPTSSWKSIERHGYQQPAHWQDRRGG